MTKHFSELRSRMSADAQSRSAAGDAVPRFFVFRCVRGEPDVSMGTIITINQLSSFFKPSWSIPFWCALPG